MGKNNKNSGMDTFAVCLSIIICFVLGIWLFPPAVSSEMSLWDNFLKVLFWIIVFLWLTLYILLQHKKIQYLLSAKFHISQGMFKISYAFLFIAVFGFAFIKIDNLHSDEYKAAQHAEYEAKMESKKAEEEIKQKATKAIEEQYISGPENSTKYTLNTKYQLDKIIVVFNSIDIYKGVYTSGPKYFATVIDCDIINNTEESVDWMLTSSSFYGTATINGIECNLAGLTDIPENLITGDILKRGTLNSRQKISGCFQVVISERSIQDNIDKLRKDDPMDFSFYFYESQDKYEPHYELQFSLNKE